MFANPACHPFIQHVGGPGTDYPSSAPHEQTLASMPEITADHPAINHHWYYNTNPVRIACMLFVLAMMIVALAVRPAAYQLVTLTLPAGTFLYVEMAFRWYSGAQVFRGHMVPIPVRQR